ncbi:MAG: hypothetical protein U1A27_04610 [Phycisphaerae bacterium]
MTRSDEPAPAARGRTLAEWDFDGDAVRPLSGARVAARDTTGLTLQCVDRDPQVALGGRLRPQASESVLEIVIESNVGGVAQVFWDTGDGLSEADSARCDVRAGTVQACRVYLPPGVRGLRLDPLDRPGLVTLRSIRQLTAAPAGAWLFPFAELAAAAGPTGGAWLGHAVAQRAISERVVGAEGESWPGWLARWLPGGGVARAVQFGALDDEFARAAVTVGLARECVGVRRDAEPRAWPAAPVDLLVLTGFCSNGAADAARWEELSQRYRAARWVVVERLSRLDAAALERRAAWVNRCLAGLPAGWAVGRIGPRYGATAGPDLGGWLAERRAIESQVALGGTLLSPLMARLSAELLAVRPATLTAALIDNVAACEELLIESGALPSEWGLQVSRGG